jgi:uncharacterized membrane-anchored protein YhcB (DUF1043 family)
MGMIAFFAGLIIGLSLGAILMALILACLKMFQKTKADLDLGKNEIPLPQDQCDYQAKSLIISMLSRGSFTPPEQTLR